jgi:hypothetical protein
VPVGFTPFPSKIGLSNKHLCGLFYQDFLTLPLLHQHLSVTEGVYFSSLPVFQWHLGWPVDIMRWLLLVKKSFFPALKFLFVVMRRYITYDKNFFPCYHFWFYKTSADRTTNL